MFPFSFKHSLLGLRANEHVLPSSLPCSALWCVSERCAVDVASFVLCRSSVLLHNSRSSTSHTDSPASFLVSLYLVFQGSYQETLLTCFLRLLLLKSKRRQKKTCSFFLIHLFSIRRVEVCSKHTRLHRRYIDVWCVYTCIV